MTSATIVTAATPAMVLALVELAKQFGIRGRWSMLLAFILGMAISTADYLVVAGGWVTTQGVYAAVVSGAVLGLAASGIWDLAQVIVRGRTVEIEGEPTQPITYLPERSADS